MEREKTTKLNKNGVSFIGRVADREREKEIENNN